MNKPILELYLNVRSGDYRLAHYAVKPDSGFIVATGVLQPIPKLVMHEAGLAIILEALNRFGKSPPIPSELSVMKSSARTRFFRDHKSIGITLDSPNIIELQAIRKVRSGGGIGVPEGRRIVDLPLPHEEFIRFLNETFDLCS